MTKQFKINKEQFLLLRKKTNIEVILSIAIYIILPIAIGISYQQINSKIWLMIFYSQGIIHVHNIVKYFIRSNNEMYFLNNYSITFSENTIIRQTPSEKKTFINSQPIPFIKKIRYKDITQIKETANKNIINSEAKGDHINLIVIPAQIENYNDLKTNLEIIQPIKTSNIECIELKEQTFLIPTNTYKNFRFNTLSRIAPIFLIVIFLSITLFNQENKHIEMIFVATIGYAINLIFMILSKMFNRTRLKYTDYNFTIDTRLVFEEYKGHINVIPINKISNVVKSISGKLSITRSKGIMHNNLEKTIHIPDEIINKNVLENKLNAIKTTN